MKKITYTHLPRVNQEANNNLVTKNMILSKSFNIKSLKIAASCLLSSIVAISILGIANKSVAQDENGRTETYAVMRLSKPGDVLWIRREPTIVEKVILPVRNLSEKEAVPEPEPELSENVIGQIKYMTRVYDNGASKQYLYPTTIVKLSICRTNGWCRLEKIIYNEGNEGHEWINPSYNARFNDSYSEDQGRPLSLEAWVPSSNFCEITQQRNFLLDCSPTTRLVANFVIDNIRYDNRARLERMLLNGE